MEKSSLKFGMVYCVLRELPNQCVVIKVVQRHKKQSSLLFGDKIQINSLFKPRTPNPSDGTRPPIRFYAVILSWLRQVKLQREILT